MFLRRRICFGNRDDDAVWLSLLWVGNSLLLGSLYVAFPLLLATGVVDLSELSDDARVATGVFWLSAPAFFCAFSGVSLAVVVACRRCCAR